MKRHLKRHLGRKPWKCWMCNFASERKDCLRSHCYRKHEMSEEEFRMRADEIYQTPKKKEMDF